MARGHLCTRFPLRGAILGFGNVAEHAHLPVWQNHRHFEIEAVLEPDPVRAQRAKALLPEARIYSDIDPLLAGNDLDFVGVCTPPCFHADLTVKACQAGLHVFCEKPLVTSLDRLHWIEQAAEESERLIFTVNNWKYAPLWAEASHLIRENRIGAVQSISLTVLRPSGSGGGVSDWRKRPEISGGGILLDHGWHHLYLIFSILKELPLAVSARMDYSQTNVEETADLLIQFRRAEARMHLTWQAECRRNFGEIRGDAGTLLLNDDHMVLRPEGVPERRYDFPQALSAGSHHPEWMKPVVEAFRREIMYAQMRGTNWVEGKWCAQALHLAYQSQRKGSCPIKVGDPIA